MMNEHPILFSTEMVKAILDGRKTQTRRVIKLADGALADSDNIPAAGYDGQLAPYVMDFSKTYPRWTQRDCPYGQPGDRLWVRETWSCIGAEQVKPSEIAPGYTVYYATDDIARNWRVNKWRPSIFMPRWASRITLEVTGVRVERVQDIRDEDILDEGMIAHSPNGVFSNPESVSRNQFVVLWDSINAKRGYSWESNPWVWVVEFKRVSQ
jgi:hypothetical protein